jgi:phosphoglycolate phosphatase-like HAD superfamily hydrolase
MSTASHNIRAVLFDLDGTLLDTAPDMASAINELRREKGLDPLPFNEVRPMVSHGARALGDLESGGIAWGVVTNKPGCLAEPLLEQLALRDRAGVIVSGDTLSESKPHPAPLLHAAQSLLNSLRAQCEPPGKPGEPPGLPPALKMLVGSHSGRESAFATFNASAATKSSSLTASSFSTPG